MAKNNNRTVNMEWKVEMTWNGNCVIILISGSCDLLPLALIRQKKKEQRHLACLSFFLFPQQDHSSGTCLYIVKPTEFLRSLLPGARVAFPVWRGQGGGNIYSTALRCSCWVWLFTGLVSSFHASLLSLDLWNRVHGSRTHCSCSKGLHKWLIKTTLANMP